MSTGLRRRVPRPRRSATVFGMAALVATLAASTALTANKAAVDEPTKKVRICHASSSESNPYVSNEPAIANNGDLQGGHLNDIGPVFPANDWGDIIPPYTYLDADDKPQTFPGYNWTPAGQAIWQNGCNVPSPITPTLECVERMGDSFLAHFGYDNPNSTRITPSVNKFSPAPENRGQPPTFEPGSHPDMLPVEFDTDVTWSLTTKSKSASSSSPRCQGSLTVVKDLVPSTDDGRFDLTIDGDVAASAVGNRGTVTKAVTADRHTVSETAVSPAKLADYTIQIVCRTGNGAGDVVAQGDGAELSVPVRRNDVVVCTITNAAKPKPKTVTPMLECVVFRDGVPDIAVWGYENSNGRQVKVPICDSNTFAPAPENLGQP